MYSRMSSRCLFIDGCNVFIRSINFNTTPREWFNQQKEHIDRFVNAAKKSKYQLIVYFDTMPAETKIVTEADLKRQLKQSYYKLPGFFSFVIEYLIVNLKLTCYTNTSYQLDDVLASHASHAKGILVSKDRDFFLYKNRQYMICNNWYVNKYTGELMIKGVIPNHNNISSDMRTWKPTRVIEPYYLLPNDAAPQTKLKRNEWKSRVLLNFNSSIMKEFKIESEPLAYNGELFKRGVNKSLLAYESIYQGLLPFTRYILYHNNELSNKTVDHSFYDFNKQTNELECKTYKLSSDDIDDSEIYLILDSIMSQITRRGHNMFLLACDHSDWIASLLLPEWSNFDTYLKLTVHSYILNGIYHLCLNHNYHISFIQSMLWLADNL